MTTLDAAATDAPRLGAARVTGLYVYPLKSAGGLAPHAAELTGRGLRHDREFMLVAPDGRHLSQREIPRMALLRPGFDGRVLRVAAPDTPPLAVEVDAGGPRRAVRVHRDPCFGIDQGDHAARWFAAVLGRPCRLVWFPPDHVRRVDPDYGDGRVGYADAFPLLLISQESLDELNRRLADPLPMNRFRPNIVVSGWGEPHGEDHVRLLRIGAVEIELVKPCARCVVTTVDQTSGRRGREPLRTLARYRRVGRKVMFGWNALPRACGEIRLDDPVTVLASSPLPSP